MSNKIRLFHLEPWMSQAFSSSGSNTFLAKHSGDHIFSFIRNAIPFFWLQIKITLDDFLNYLVFSLSIEGWLSWEKYVECDTSRPDVTFLSIFLSKDLRCCVPNSTDWRFHSLKTSLRKTLTLELSSKTKIYKFDNFSILITEDEILWLNISVTYIMFVNIVNSLKDLAENLSRFIFCEAFLIL